MKISGYAIERIHKNMYRIINTDGQQVGIIERSKQASVALELGAGTHAEPQSLPTTRGTHRTGQQPPRNAYHLH